MNDKPKQLKLNIPDETPLPPPGKHWYMGDEETPFNFEDAEVIEKMSNKTFLILVIYDIVENKQRTKIAKKLLGWGERVQRSAFECHLTIKQYDLMLRDILPLVNEELDLLRVYRLTGHAELRVWGKIPETYDEEVVII
jgi:CRISPR-associated protein Cas2